MVRNAVEDILKLNIDDPTDFSDPTLRTLDGSLRCPICSNLYEGPVVLPCGHSFCSLCVRNAIADKPQCPTCRKEATEFHIRVNASLEDAVVAWSKARCLVLDLLKERRDASEATTENEEPVHETRPHKRRRMSPEAENASGPSSLTRHLETVASRSSLSSKPKGITREDSGSNRSLNTDCVDCPVCDKPVQLAKINAHIDSGCKSLGVISSRASSSGSRSKPAASGTVKRENTQKMEWAKLLDGKAMVKGKDKTKDVVDANTTPLPKVSYSLLKEKYIRDYLAEWELSTNGDKATLTSRHQRWVMIYNANLDRGPTQRRQVPELRAEMKRWEEERKALASGKKGPGKDAVKDAAEYQKAHKAEFDALIARARPQKSSSATASSSPAETTPKPPSTPTSWNQQRSSVTPEDDSERRTELALKSDAIIIDDDEEES